VLYACGCRLTVDRGLYMSLCGRQSTALCAKHLLLSVLAPPTGSRPSTINIQYGKPSKWTISDGGWIIGRWVHWHVYGGVTDAQQRRSKLCNVGL